MSHRSLTEAGPRPVRRSLTGALLALVCAGSLLLATACGSSSSSSGDPVAKAALASASAPGYKMNLTMSFSSPGLASGLSATGNGSFDVKDHAGSFNLALNLGNSPQVVQALGSSTLQIQEIIDGLTIYVKLPSSIAQKLPGAKPWLKVDLAKLASSSGIPGLSSLGSNPASSDPSQLLQYLKAVSGSITKVGTEQVNGVQTTHYRATIDLDRVPNALPASSRASGRQAIQALEKSSGTHQLPVDAWIDSQNLVRRMQLSFSSTSSGQRVTALTTIDIPEYGPHSAPAIPPADPVTDAGALLGAGG